jgi:LAS superfamily LD-carboxypeptidase LdcB
MYKDTSSEKGTSVPALVLIGALMVCIVAIEGYLAFTLHKVSQQLSSTREAVATLEVWYASSTETSTERYRTLSDVVYDQGKALEGLLANVEGFDAEVGQLSGSVKTLEKLTTTDPELLQKYSKVYFLNEHYKPADLATLNEKYDLINGKEVTIHSEVRPFLHELLESAERDDVDLMVLSGYRSYVEQESLKGAYTVRYGTGANQFSADQGYSEHQLGTAVDFTTTVDGENLAKFVESSAFAWLNENAYRYGFILSYPQDNAYYQYEPWHWRFVGKDLAKYLHTKNAHFYDLEQREIDAYIPTLFDD